MIYEIIIAMLQKVYFFWTIIEKICGILSRDIAQFQYKTNIYISDPKSMDPKEFLLLQCNGLELNRPDITIRYLAVNDIVNGMINDGKGLRIYKKFWQGDGQDSDRLVNNLTALVNSFADHGYNQNCFITCDKKMEIFDGGHRLACALFFGVKTIRVRNTITNWDQESMWVRMINAGLSDEEIDIIRHESDLLIEGIINCHEKEIEVDHEALIKWICKEYKKVYGFDIIELNGKSYVTLNKGGFYQSLPKLGIDGARPTDIRIDMYGLKDLLNTSMDVLDIGCNIGFIDMEIASSVRSVTGIEFNSAASELSQKIAKKLNIYNATFISADFKEWKNPSHRKYDVIFSFAVYKWIGLKPQENATKLASLIKKGGFVIFEGHSLESEEHNDYGDYVDAFINNGFGRVKMGYSTDDKSTNRIWTLFQYNG